jgi:hypothetical protein
MSWNTEKRGYIKTWAQDIRNSYKIRLKYVLVPKGVDVESHFVDTPYRFETYKDAREYAKELFPCYSFVVEGSADTPNFNEREFVNRGKPKEVENAKYSQVFSVKEPILFTKGTNVESRETEEEIRQKLVDIEILRAKLDKKEAELKKQLESNSGNSKKNTKNTK